MVHDMIDEGKAHGLTFCECRMLSCECVMVWTMAWKKQDWAGMLCEACNPVQLDGGLHSQAAKMYFVCVMLETHERVGTVL